jgi:5-hydroxyisourate hydrolase
VITTHVLDTTRGRPATGVPVILERQAGDGWEHVGHGETDADGRLRTLTAGGIDGATYRLTFDTRQYFESTGTRAFYPQVTVVFEVADGKAHYHVPLLLSPFGYSTYRGS